MGRANEISCFLVHIRDLVGKRPEVEPETETAPAIATEKKREAEEAACLTRREREIVDLLADGLTNQEIADQLFISAHTVHKHLENIRVKLGVNSRIGILNKVKRL
ncbi:MAG: helix-turn-helix transcriptional regulator [Firmicutes bacterium]|nr:helix-turn-helix transcriptional regulator [Bacillota bacterium]